MAKGHRSQIKKERNETNVDRRPKAHAKFVRLADTKARIVLEQIKGKGVKEAAAILNYSPRYAAYIINKVLHSAIANAEHNLGMDPSTLYVEEAIANRGSAYYGRFRLSPRAKGRAYRTEIKMSHITLVLNEKKKK